LKRGGASVERRKLSSSKSAALCRDAATSRYATCRLQPCLPLGFGYLRAVSAAEIIEQIKALPPQEKALVMDFIREVEAESGDKSNASYLNDAAFEAARRKVFAKHAELLKRLAQ